MAKKSAYEILGVQPSASLEEITLAYKRMAMLNHPDKVSHLALEFRELAERRMREINMAFAALKEGKGEFQSEDIADEYKQQQRERTSAGQQQTTEERRQKGWAEPSLASKAEVRAHKDARRFARLLVSEIKLYNGAKVAEGRRYYDLYERLKDNIDRSRKVYEKRISPIVAAKFDYFYDELVHMLAEGDVAKFGRNFPGPSESA